MLGRIIRAGMWLSGGVLVLTILAAAAAYAFSVEVQRIRPYDEIRRQLTGQIGVEEGSPIRAVIFDRSVLIERERKIPAIDTAAHYPIQLRTVLYFATAIGLAAAVALVACGVVHRFVCRKLAPA